MHEVHTTKLVLGINGMCCHWFIAYANNCMRLFAWFVLQNPKISNNHFRPFDVFVITDLYKFDWIIDNFIKNNCRFEGETWTLSKVVATPEKFKITSDGGPHESLKPIF